MIHKGQKGFTLLELLIAIALTALIATGITMAISQTFTGSVRNSNHMVAVRQAQEAGYWVSYYGYSAQNTTITGVSGFPLILQWVDFDTSQAQKIVFSLNSSGLKGSYYVNGVLNSTQTGKIPVFNVIDNSTVTKTNCKISGGSDFSLPDNGDAFKITGGATNDTGRITLTGGTISVNWTAGATCLNVSGGWSWNTTTTGANITVTAGVSGAKGSWTSETKAATAAISVDSDNDATLSSARGLIFTVTATAGTGQQHRLESVTESETRIYIVVPKPVS